MWLRTAALERRRKPQSKMFLCPWATLQDTQPASKHTPGEHCSLHLVLARHPAAAGRHQQRKMIERRWCY